MRHNLSLKAVCACALIAVPAWAQETETETGMTEAEMQEADRAAENMITRLYVREVPAYATTGEVIERLQGLGYTNITEFDVEWNHYEVEAIAPNGEEVEIEVDPVTGQILDVEENWF